MTSQIALVHSSTLSLGGFLIEMTYDVLFLIIGLQIFKMIFAVATAWMPDKHHVKALKTLEILMPDKKPKEPPCSKRKDH